MIIIINTKFGAVSAKSQYKYVDMYGNKLKIHMKMLSILQGSM